jgi:hypothetical protein
MFTIIILIFIVPLQISGLEIVVQVGVGCGESSTGRREKVLIHRQTVADRNGLLCGLCVSGQDTHRNSLPKATACSKLRGSLRIRGSVCGCLHGSLGNSRRPRNPRGSGV